MSPTSKATADEQGRHEKATRANRPVTAAHTSASRIALRRKQADALNYREIGYSFEQIAAEMKRPITTIHRWITEAMDRLVKEPAERVLAIELSRRVAYGCRSPLLICQAHPLEEIVAKLTRCEFEQVAEIVGRCPDGSGAS